MSHDLRRGAAFALAGAAAFACMSALIKYAGRELPDAVVVFFRNLCALSLLLPWLATRASVSLATRRIGMHLLRAAVGLAAMYCFFFAIARLPLASAVVLNYSQPLFLPLIAWVWIGERPPRRIYPAIALGFFGVVLILKPGLGWAGPAGIVGLCAGVLAATAMASIRRMSDTEPTLRIVIYFSLFASLASALPAAWFWQSPTPGQWLALAGAGASAAVGQMSLTRAYALAPAAHIGALVYTTVLFAALLAWIVWQETPDALSVVGGAAVIAAAIIVVFARRRRAPAA